MGRAIRDHKNPRHISKTVRPTVKIDPLGPTTFRLVRRSILMLGCAREYGEISVSDGANASRPSEQMRNPAPLLQAWPFTSQSVVG